MHVLSLPPAFVLSQDQTLMLRIQSRLNHVILNRRELTLVSKRITAPKRGVFSCSKRNRRSLFPEPKSLPVPQASPPTFLFLLFFNCQITDQSNQSKSIPAIPGTQARNHQSASQPIQETPERVTSSPAAPPPSSVIGLIDPTSRYSQHHHRKNSDIFLSTRFITTIL